MILNFAFLLAFHVTLAALAAGAPSCGPNNLCPASSPCCSLYGVCGVGAYCLGGCDPKYSHSLDSCVASPVCRSADYELNSLDDMMPIDEYLGDSSEANWIYSGNPVMHNGNILLTLAADNVGTLMATTKYIWYGKVSARLTTSRSAGVVTAFILMSNVKDEIDFEFVGVDVENTQSNFYSQGVTNYNNGMNLSTSNTFENVHNYTIDWKPDSITWAIDGDVMRTLYRDDTWNATSESYHYPQTPSRVMLSLWPAGLPSNDEGTINWAGGEISWDSPYMQNGYYYAMIADVSVECYDPPDGANVTGSMSYIYNDYAATNDTVAVVDDDTILASFYATGEEPDKEPEASTSVSSSHSGTNSPSPHAQVETVPGMSGSGSRSNEEISHNSSTEDSETDSSVEPSGTSTNSDSFSQTDNETSAAGNIEKGVVRGSLFAVCIALLGLLVS